MLVAWKNLFLLFLSSLFVLSFRNPVDPQYLTNPQSSRSSHQPYFLRRYRWIHKRRCSFRIILIDIELVCWVSAAQIMSRWESHRVSWFAWSANPAFFRWPGLQVSINLRFWWAWHAFPIFSHICPLGGRCRSASFSTDMDPWNNPMGGPDGPNELVHLIGGFKHVHIYSLIVPIGHELNFHIRMGSPLHLITFFRFYESPGLFCLGKFMANHGKTSVWIWRTSLQGARTGRLVLIFLIERSLLINVDVAVAKITILEVLNTSINSQLALVGGDPY